MLYSIMGKATWGIFKKYEKSYEEAYQRALKGVKYLYDMGAKKVWLFGSIIRPELHMKGSDIDIAVVGIPEGKRFTIEATLIDILHPYDFDLVFLDGKDIIIREEIMEAIRIYGKCIEKF